MKDKCLCGAIEVAAAEQQEVGLCHCSMCRRWSGGPMFAVHCGADVQFNGQIPTVYRSSEWAERGFCSSCGTHLFYHLLPNDEYILPAGLFQNAALTLTNEIFVDQQPAFYEFSNRTHKMTGAEVFAQFAPRHNECRT